VELLALLGVLLLVYLSFAVSASAGLGDLAALNDALGALGVDVVDA